MSSSASMDLIDFFDDALRHETEEWHAPIVEVHAAASTGGVNDIETAQPAVEEACLATIAWSDGRDVQPAGNPLAWTRTSSGEYASMEEAEAPSESPTVWDSLDEGTEWQVLPESTHELPSHSETDSGFLEDPPTIEQIRQEISLSLRQREIPFPSSSLREVERVRNFVAYMLAIDYRVDVPVYLSARDRTHFLRLSCRAVELNRQSVTVSAADEEGEVLAQFLWRFVYNPCRALGMSSNQLLSKLWDLFTFSSLWGKYPGAGRGTLQRYGFDMLAKKIWTDRETILGAVVRDPETRSKYVAKMDEYQSQYFESIAGFDAASVPCQDQDGERRSELSERIRYELNERGRAYRDAQARGTSRWAYINSLPSPAALTEAKTCIRKFWNRTGKSRARDPNMESAEVNDRGSSTGDRETAVEELDLWEHRRYDRALF